MATQTSPLAPSSRVNITEESPYDAAKGSTAESAAAAESRSKKRRRAEAQGGGGRGRYLLRDYGSGAMGAQIVRQQTCKE